MIFHTARLATEKAVIRPALPLCSMPGISEMQMTKLSYADQLKHPNWQRKRLESLQAADFQCSECSDKETTLHVHHKRYVKGRMAWEYEQSELKVLCETCHKNTHTAQEKLEILLREDFKQMPVSGFAFGFLTGFLCPFNKVAQSMLDDAAQVEPAAVDMGLVLAALGPSDLATALKKKIDEGRLPGVGATFDSFLADWLGA